MTDRFRAQLGDILVSSVILAVGIIGLIMTMDFPDRAAMWASWIMRLLILCTAAHLGIIFWKLRSADKGDAS